MRRLIGLADALSVSAAALLCAVMLARVGFALESISLPAFALGLAVGFFAADVASGVVHWLSLRSAWSASCCGRASCSGSVGSCWR